MTLIEVVAGLALLGSVLAGVLVTKAAYTRQARAAERRSAAAAEADALLTAWWGDQKLKPRDDAGLTPKGFRWVRRIRPDPKAEALGMQVLHLELTDPSTSVPESPVVVVELVVPRKGAAHETAK
jgi:hypothetical protein